MNKIVIQKITTLLTVLELGLCLFNLSCKQISSDPNVIGGIKTNKYPGVIQILTQKTNENYLHTCTASVVSSTTLITAAHCLETNTKAVHTAKNNKYISTTKFISHPKYTGKANQYDIAVVVFDNAPFTVTPIIPLFDKVEKNTPVTLIGYGCPTQYSKDGKVECKQDRGKAIKRMGTSEIISLNDTPIVSDLSLRYLNPTNTPCNKNMIELKHTTNTSDQEINVPTGKDVAISRGDSGGPLLIDKQGSAFFVGVASNSQEALANKKQLASCYVPLYLNTDFLKSTESEINADIPGI